MAKKTPMPVPDMANEFSIPDYPMVVAEYAVVWVKVAVAHDDKRLGRLLEVPLTERTQNLIDSGYLEIVLPPGYEG